MKSLFFLSNKVVLLRVLRGVGGPTVGLLLVALVIESLTPAATALVLAELVDALTAGTAQPDFFRAAIPGLLAFAGILLANSLAEASDGPLVFRVTARVDGAHRAEVARLAAGSRSLAVLESPAVQQLLREVTLDPARGYDTTPAEGALAQLRWAAGLLGIAASCAVLTWYTWWLVPLVLLPALLNWRISNRQSARLAGLWRGAIKGELHADVWRQAAVSPGEGKDIRIFGFAPWMIRRMQHHVETANEAFWAYVAHIVRSQWGQFSLAAVGLVPAYVSVAVSAADGRTRVAVEAAVLAAGWSVFQALGRSMEQYKMVSALRVIEATRNLRAALDPVDGPVAPPAWAATAHSVKHDSTSGQVSATAGLPATVRFEGVTFTYPGGSRPVLHGLDLEIRPGELLAIVGLNGAGKSTLIKLLAGLYTPSGGRITADGRNIEELGIDDWRSRLSIVFQDFVRYHLSAADNVSLGQARKAPDPVALEGAAREAGLDAVLSRLPNGWDTPLARVRTGGVDLSGGQWQQVVLARALYAVWSGARLLVLDEPTAHLDVRTEFDVFNRLAERRGSTSVVLISHRLSTVRMADRIVLLDGGRITESGTHDDLMALDGKYAEMFAIQAERFNRGYQDRVEEGELQ
ncbi:ABC transporter ATP-binding protein [Streptomyces sp. NBC_01298]|uniref:ABC transporter ATP-binding protein n=1 Tax=Streptomyces sp. NBC_01298 TaxID=2903817 RepID=UPI002E152720|nr:ABC transporter ATP-binding protein [Streptomyces sp. NBC_01298]